MRVHTQGYGTQEISLYAGLPRRQAVLIVFFYHHSLNNQKMRIFTWGAETNIIQNSLPLVVRDAVHTPHDAYFVLTYRNMRC